MEAAQRRMAFFFTIEHGEIVHEKHTYKGTLTLLAVRRRDEAY
jgi:hypothetical protein